MKYVVRERRFDVHKVTLRYTPRVDQRTVNNEARHRVSIRPRRHVIVTTEEAGSAKVGGPVVGTAMSELKGGTATAGIAGGAASGMALGRTAPPS